MALRALDRSTELGAGDVGLVRADADVGGIGLAAQGLGRGPVRVWTPVTVGTGGALASGRQAAAHQEREEEWREMKSRHPRMITAMAPGPKI